MQKLSSVPLFFLFVGSHLGLFLRWQFISPTSGVNYSFFLHGHSHIMFLGWIFNVLYIAFTTNHIIKKDQRFLQILFYALQLLVVGMLVSFPLQGYGFWSILFSTLHTIGSMVFAIYFFNKTKFVSTTSVWYARIALIFFVVSTAGPFSLGYLMANGLGQSVWYNLSIYFYLHFQYNGFFLFGIFGLFFSLLETKQIGFDFVRPKTMGKILAITCVPAYFLSTLWAKPGYVFNFLGGLAALIQFGALAILIMLILTNLKVFKNNFSKSTNCFLLVVMLAFAIKLLLQLLSAFPFFAQMAYELRPVVIAYLHLVLLGVISLLLFVWYLEFDLISRSLGNKTMILYLIAFAGMETCLILTPWWRTFFGYTLYSAPEYTFFFSALLSLSCFLFYISSLVKKPDKNQLSG